MAESGPFTIDGEEFRTDASGEILQTTPAVPERTDAVPVRRLKALRARKEEARRVAQMGADRITGLTREISELDTLIDNAATEARG